MNFCRLFFFSIGIALCIQTAIAQNQNFAEDIKALNQIAASAPVAPSNTNYQSTNQVSSMKSLIGDVKSMLRFVPGSAGQALQTYLDVTRPEKYSTDSAVGSANYGIISYFKDAFSNPTPAAKCLNLKAQLLYSYIDKKDLSVTRSYSGPLNGRPSLQTRVEQSNLEPGWAWKKAMQLSNNDPNEAMMLIGVCGHDDSGVREDAIDIHNIDYKARIQLSEKYGNNVLKPYSYNSVFVCPNQNSLFFSPGSLNKNADISDDLKKKIAAVQAPNKGPSVIPAKYYHVYGGAFMACKMIQDGVSPSAAVDYPPKFVSVYRRARMCSEAQDRAKKADTLNNGYQSYLSETLQAGKDPKSAKDYLLSLDTKKCESILKVPGCSANPRDQVYFTKFVDRAFAGKLYFEQQNCPSSQAGQLTDALRAFSAGSQNAFDFNKEFDCASIPTANCESAKKVLETWKVDFEWTMEQQKAGAKFAAENCKLKPKENKTLETSKNCEIPDSFFSDYFDSPERPAITTQPKSEPTKN